MDQKALEEAYIKFKNHTLSNKMLMHDREKLAVFETAGQADQRLSALAQAIKRTDNDYFHRLLDQIEVHSVPKSFIFESDSKNFINSPPKTEHWEITELNHFIDAPIELCILNTLWVTRSLYRLPNTNEKHTFANIIRLQKKEPLRGKQIFHPYTNRYKKWLENAFTQAKRICSRGKTAVILSLDLRRFYYSVRIDTGTLKAALRREESPTTGIDYFITEINLRMCQRWSKAANISLRKHKIALPLGLPSSGVLANWYLEKFDTAIIEECNPLFFGRYVDDILLVFSTSSNTHFSKAEEIIEHFLENPGVIRRDQKSYRINGYEQIQINSKKIKTFLFNQKDSVATINSIASQVIANSSAWNMFPDIDSLVEEIKNISPNLISRQPDPRLRDIENIANSRLRVSTLLAILLRLQTQSNFTKDEQHRIIKNLKPCFEGKQLLELRPLWISYITLIVAWNEKNAFMHFGQQIEVLIEMLKNREKMQTAVNCLLKDLKIAQKTALACNLAFFRQISRTRKTKKYLPPIGPKTEATLLQYRKSFLVNRHHFRVPGLLLFADFYSNRENLYQLKVSEIKPGLSPMQRLRWLHINLSHNEIYQALTISRLHNGHPGAIDHKRINRASVNLYWSINFKSSYPPTFLDTIKQQFNEPEAEPHKSIKLYTFAKSHKSDQDLTHSFRVSIPNILIKEETIREMLDGPHSTNLGHNRYRQFASVLNQAVISRATMVVLPELSIPLELLPALQRFSEFFQIAIVGGIEYVVRGQFAFNLTITILPYIRRKFKYSNTFFRLKNYYSPKDIDLIHEKKLQCPVTKKPLYHLFRWKGAWFTVFNCYELSNITDRSHFKGRVDFIATVLFNKDRHYYASIAESAAIDLHSYLINVNTSLFKGTFLIQPTSSNTMYIAEIKGGENSTVLTEKIDIRGLRAFQKAYLAGSKPNRFKPLPPGYNYCRE